MRLYLCDRDATRPGVRIYDTPADTLIDAVDVGIPPYDVTFVQEAYAGLPANPGDPGAAVLTTCPNPARHTVTIRFNLPGGDSGSPAGLGIYDIAGRLVRSLDVPGHGEGIQEVIWDGTDTRGNPVSSGVYYGSFRGRGTAGAFRIVFIR